MHKKLYSLSSNKLLFFKNLRVVPFVKNDVSHIISSINYCRKTYNVLSYLTKHNQLMQKFVLFFK